MGLKRNLWKIVIAGLLALPSCDHPKIDIQVLQSRDLTGDGITDVIVSDSKEIYFFKGQKDGSYLKASCIGYNAYGGRIYDTYKDIQFEENKGIISESLVNKKSPKID
ncbi:MAG: VCBS repeat-containing protein [Candidatus Nanoarchaeia archaeon]|nr:VCBS repeat-containing protein [Candidatus Nanoarchaeia archaeon]